MTTPLIYRSSLRDYQRRAVRECLSWLRSGRATLLVSATGAGKTVMAVAVARRFKHVLVVAHRIEIIEQARAAFGDNVTVMSIQAALRYGPGSIDLLIIDEAHRSAASTYRALIEKYASAARLGLTATPVRIDGQGLCDAFDEIVLASSIPELIAGGHLVPYRALEAPDEALKQLSHFRSQAGDWKTSDLDAVMNTPRLVGDVVREYRKQGAPRKTICFAVGIKHSLALVESFLNAGIRAAHLDGTTSRQKRAAILQNLLDGQIDVLCNVNLFTEGWDCPPVSCVIMARPTASLTLYLQSVGRGMRPFPGKNDLLILDHAGNIERHGVPDKHRTWSLENDRQREKREEEVAELERLASLGFDSIEAELEEKHRTAKTLHDTHYSSSQISSSGLFGHRNSARVALERIGIKATIFKGNKYFPKDAVDAFRLLKSESYSSAECAAKLGIARQHVGDFLRRRNIPRTRRGYGRAIIDAIAAERQTENPENLGLFPSRRLAHEDKAVIQENTYSREDVCKIIPGADKYCKGIERQGVRPVALISPKRYLKADIDRLSPGVESWYTSGQVARIFPEIFKPSRHMRRYGVAWNGLRGTATRYLKSDVDALRETYSSGRASRVNGHS